MIAYQDQKFINDCNRLIDDEGGWKLTDDPDDPDLATYAGVRYITFVDYLKNIDEVPDALKQAWNLEEFIKLSQENDPQLQDLIRLIYYDMYYVKSGASNLQHEPVLRYMIFSAAVNLGVKPTVKFIQKLVNKKHNNILTVDGKFGAYTAKIMNQYLINNDEQVFIYEFMHQWLLYYADIVKNNAHAWKEYADRLELELTAYVVSGVVNSYKAHHRPKYRRYKFLKGWINRVFKALS